MRFFWIFISVMFGWLHAGAMQHYTFTPIDVNNGLSSNQVRNITQLPDGRMAITTQGLVNIYDGSAFKYLHYTDKNSVRLSGYTGYHHDYVARNGYMWLKMYQQLFLIDIHHERFADNPAAVLRKWGITGPLNDFFMDKQHNLWLITENDDLYYLPQGKTQKQLFRRHISQPSGGKDRVYDLAVLQQRLYLFYRSGKLLCFDIQSKQELYRQQSLPSDEQAKYGSTSFVITAKNQFFQLKNGFRGGIMQNYDPETRKWNTVLQTTYWLNYLSVDHNGSIWLTCKEGMWHLNAGLTQKEFIPKLKLVDGQVIATEISTIFNDKQGGMWLGTLNRGLLYYHPDRFKFKNIGKSVFKVALDANINISCFAKMPSGNIAVGTRQGLYVYNTSVETLTPLIQARGLVCNALLTDRNNRVWIALDGKGLASLEPNGQLRYYSSSPRYIFSLVAETDSTLTLSTGGEGFGVFNKARGAYRRTLASKPATYSTVLQTAVIDKNALAGIYSGGFFLYSKRSGKIKLYPNTKGYNSLLADRNQQIWLASKDGLHVRDAHGRLRQSFYTSNGLVNNYVQAIAQAPDGAIWVSTSGGLTRITTVKGKDGKIGYTFAGYNRLDGVIANEFWERSVFINADGSIFWGGTDGFNVLAPGRVATGRPMGAPLLVTLQLFNKRLESGMAYNGNVILKKPLLLTRQIELKHNQNFFGLEFAALNYVNPTQTYYRYQLVGIDAEEQELQAAGGNGQVGYTNVPPGTYYFRVRAAGNNASWSSNYAELKIVVRAPFWKTGLAYLIYALAIVGALVLAIGLYLSRKRKKLVREQKQKLDQMKSAFLKNINTEINEPLAHIIIPLNNLLQHTDEGRLKLQLKEIQGNAIDLQNLVGQLSADVLAPVEGKENELNMDLLLLNMRRLLETQQERQQHDGSKENKPGGNNILLNAIDEKLIERALDFVQQNLNNPNYSVELLSRDMGMDRTGLYRKLVHVIGKTPTTFIRSVRLKRAAQLLEEGLTVAEVADRVGFSTASYLTKCFQEEFGIKPSQYVASIKTSKTD